MSIRRYAVRSAFALVLSATLASRLFAQDPFELEVYTPATAAPGEWELGINTNYVADGSTTFDGPLAPTDRQGRLSVELTHGITHLWEVTVYGLAASRPGDGADWAGWRFRTRVRAPDSWRLPVRLGINVELDHTRPHFAEREYAVEVVPVVAWRQGRLALAVNLPLEHAIGRGAVKGWEIEPAARADVVLSQRVTITTEYFSSLGELGDLDPPAARKHLLFPGVALHLGDDIAWNAAVGFGLNDATDRLVLKTGIEFPLHE